LNDSPSSDLASKKSGDDLDNWSAERNNSVADSNTDAAATNDLAGVIDGWQNNPDAVLQSLGIPPYIPGMSSMVPPPGYGSGLYGPSYGSLYSSGLYGSGLYGYGLYGSPYGPGLYGLTAYSPLLLYGMPLYRPYGTYAPSYIYRGLTTVPGHPGYVPRSFGTVRTGVGISVGRPAIGVVHAGGHR
jgi:hypothetical protein